MVIVDTKNIPKRRATRAERAEVCDFFRDPEGASDGKPGSYAACVAMAAAIEEGLVSVHMIIPPGGTEDDEQPMMQRLKNDAELAEEARLRAGEHEIH